MDFSIVNLKMKVQGSLDNNLKPVHNILRIMLNSSKFMQQKYTSFGQNNSNFSKISKILNKF